MIDEAWWKRAGNNLGGDVDRDSIRAVINEECSVVGWIFALEESDGYRYAVLEDDRCMEVDGAAVVKKLKAEAGHDEEVD